MSFVLDMRTNAALGEALADGGFVGTVRGGGGWVEVRTEQARAFFELVAAHGARLTSTGVE